jgi:Mlc titration factor MtfA (ptsG expression regulator)/Tfp pilus assembly protein PilF
MTDEIRVTIAGQAAMLLLGLDDYHFDELRTVLVYPGSFLAQYEDPLGIENEYRRNLGEAYEGGPVILSWWDALWGGRRLGDVNVVLHEFAHKLAELGDPRVGRPPLVEESLRERWDRVMAEEYRRFCADVEHGRPVLLDPYGADSPAEFFAVATEYFFIRADAMRRRHPELYRLLADFYRQEPADRPVGEELLRQSGEADREYARHAVEECTVGLRHRPDDTELLLERAHHLCDLGDYPAALADCSRLLALAGSDDEQADALLERGYVQREAGSDDEALADFNEAIRLCPDFLDALSHRAALHADRGDHAAALADLAEVLRLDPKNDDALMQRADIYREQEKFAKAERDLEKVIRLTRTMPLGYVRRAELRLDQERFDEAIADCDRALALQSVNDSTSCTLR